MFYAKNKLLLVWFFIALFECKDSLCMEQEQQQASFLNQTLSALKTWSWNSYTWIKQKTSEYSTKIVEKIKEKGAAFNQWVEHSLPPQNLSSEDLAYAMQHGGDTSDLPLIETNQPAQKDEEEILREGVQEEKPKPLGTPTPPPTKSEENYAESLEKITLSKEQTTNLLGTQEITNIMQKQGNLSVETFSNTTSNAWRLLLKINAQLSQKGVSITPKQFLEAIRKNPQVQNLLSQGKLNNPRATGVPQYNNLKQQILALPNVIAVGTTLSKQMEQEIKAKKLNWNNTKEVDKYDPPHTIQWELDTEIQDKIIWLKSIQQYNGWMCGWMALYNVIEIINPLLLDKKFDSIIDFIKEIQNSEKNNLNTRYYNFAQFQRQYAQSIYGYDLHECGNILGLGAESEYQTQINALNPEDRNIEVLKTCKIATDDYKKYMNNDFSAYNRTTMLGNTEINNFLLNNNHKNVYVCSAWSQSNLDHGSIQHNSRSFGITHPTGISLLQNSPDQCSLIFIISGHITVITKVTLTTGETFVMLMNSENLYDSSARTASRGNWLNHICKNLLIGSK